MESHTGRAGMARGRLFVAAAAILWSLSGVVTKSDALGSLDGLTIAFYRSLFAGLALFPFVSPRRWEFSPALVGMSLVFGATVGTFLESVRATTAANAIFLQCSATFWTAMLTAVLLRERLDRRSILGIACALPGVLAIVAFGHGGSPREWLGVALGLTSGLGYAVVTVTMRHLRHLSPAWLSAANNLGGAATLAVAILVLQGHLPRPSTTQSLLLAGFGVIQLAIPYALFARGLRAVPAPEAGLITLIEPILNPLWVVLVQHERPRPATLVGGLFLVLAVAVRYVPLGGGKGRRPEPNLAAEEPSLPIEPPGSG